MRLTRIPIIAASIAALSIAAAPAAAAPAPAPSEFFGANIQALIRSGFAPRQSWPSYLRAMGSSGMTIARFDAPWAWAQPKSATQAYDWSQTDGVAAALATQGVRWLPVIDFPPDWAKAGGTRIAPGNYPAFAAFAQAFAGR